MGIWEAINKSTSNLSLAGGELAWFVAKGSVDRQPIRVIIARDSAKVVPNENEDGFFEVVDMAIGQYRTRLDFGSRDGTPLALTGKLAGGRIELDDESETWSIEYVVARDTYIVKTYGAKLV